MSNNLFGPTSYRGLLPVLQEEDEDDKPQSKGFSFEFGTTSAGNSAAVIIASDAEDLQISGQGGTQIVDIAGNINGGQIDLGDGNDRVQVRGGSVVNNVEFALGDDDDMFTQQVGSVLQNSDVLGQDGSDRLSFAGHNEGTYINPGRNKEDPDITILQDTVTGDLDIADPENWKVKPKDGSEWGRDQLILAGDWEGRGSRRYNTNLFGGGGDKVYSGFERREGDRLAARIDVKGDKTAIEYVALVDENGKEIDTLQAVEPEYVFENQWAKYTGQVLVVAGSVIPGAQVLIPVGLAMQTAFELDNNIASWESTGLNALQGAASVSGVGWLSQSVDVGVAAYRGDYGGAAIGAAGFLPEGSSLRKGINATGTGYRSYQAADNGNIAGAISSASTIPGIAGGDQSGWIARGGSIAGNAYGAGEAIAEGNIDGVLQYGTALPYDLGFDDDRTVMAIGDYSRAAYRLGSYEFGRNGNNAITDTLDLAAGANVQDTGLTQHVVSGNKNLAYQAPPEFEQTDDGRLVAKNPGEVAEYLDYIDKFRTPEGFDSASFVREVRTGHMSPRDQAQLFQLVEQHLQSSAPPAPSPNAPELPEGYVYIVGRDRDTGQFVGYAALEDQLDEGIAELEAAGFEWVGSGVSNAAAYNAQWNADLADNAGTASNGEPVPGSEGSSADTTANESSERSHPGSAPELVLTFSDEQGTHYATEPVPNDRAAVEQVYTQLVGAGVNPASISLEPVPPSETTQTVQPTPPAEPETPPMDTNGANFGFVETSFDFSGGR